MQTQLIDDILDEQQLQEADSILRSCVHCGFCLATCPTYQLLGDELDSPRGRIYLIKNALEGAPVSDKTLLHLDRCLTCRACETTCPSGVQYAQLLDIGRQFIEQQRNPAQQFMRFIVRKVTTTPMLFNRIAWLIRHSKNKFPESSVAPPRQGKVLLLGGCVQPQLAPNINSASVNVLNKLGFEVSVTAQQFCCGALDQHLSAPAAAREKIKRNLDNWYAQLNNGADYLITNASGCGAMVLDYAHLVKDDANYLAKANYVIKRLFDLGAFLSKQNLQAFITNKDIHVSVHTPCTLYHAHRAPMLVSTLLSQLGYRVQTPNDAHLCCGSAGTYSVFQPKIATQLRTDKLAKLQQVHPDIIVTANIGCLLHLQKGTTTPVKHWIELLAEHLADG